MTETAEIITAEQMAEAEFKNILGGFGTVADVSGTEAVAGVADITQSANLDAIPTKEVLIGLITPICMIWAPNWNIQPKEINALAGAYADVIDKYWPDLDLGVEVNAALITAMILGPRLKMPRIIQQQPIGEES